MVKRGRPPADWLYRVLDLEHRGEFIPKDTITGLIGVSSNSVVKQFEKLGVSTKYLKESGRVKAHYGFEDMRAKVLEHLKVSDNPDYGVSKRHRD